MTTLQATWTATPRPCAYATARGRSSGVKFAARLRMPKRPVARYTASAPNRMAYSSCSGPPAGASSSSGLPVRPRTGEPERAAVKEPAPSAEAGAVPGETVAAPAEPVCLATSACRATPARSVISARCATLARSATPACRATSACSAIPIPRPLPPVRPLVRVPRRPPDHPTAPSPGTPPRRPQGPGRRRWPRPRGWRSRAPRA